jgi:hypothetical protein
MYVGEFLMGILHRELIGRKIATTLILSIVMLCVMIFLSNLIGDIRVRTYKIQKITDPIIALITITFFILETIKCRIKYKYSIIADKLMIHKVSSNVETILEKIRLTDIVYIGQNNKNKAKKKINIFSSKSYICSKISRKTYCCIYKLGEGYKKVYFQPSEELINKINRFNIRYKKAI